MVFERKVLLKKKKDNKDFANSREHREWYCTVLQWETDFNALGVDGRIPSDGAADSNGNSGLENSNRENHSSVMDGGGAPAGAGGHGDAGASGEAEEEFIVPADEHFTRCPVSREMFESIWDNDEGELMYRNAVKVLVTEAADSALYQLGQPCDIEGSSVRYLLVHKLLVMDGWLALGKASTLADAVQRYELMGAQGVEKATILRDVAACDDESEEDIFVLLELTS